MPRRCAARTMPAMPSLRKRLAPAFVVTVSLAGCNDPPPVTPERPPMNPPDMTTPSPDAIDPNDRSAHLAFGRSGGKCTVQRTTGPGSRAAVPTTCPPILLDPAFSDCDPAVVYRHDGKDECECHHFANPPIVEKRACPAGHP
jgi:hypothetical protein